MQVKAKSSQDMCNYPTMLNSKVAWLDRVVDSADRAPTQQSFEFYEEMRKRAESALQSWKNIKERDIAELNNLARRHNLATVVLGYSPDAATRRPGAADDR